MASNVDTNYSGLFNLPIPVNQLNPLPTDARYVKDTLAEAITFAASGATAYIGELIYVKENNKLYIINNDSTLKEVGSGGGSDVSVDDVTIKKNSSNVISVAQTITGAYYNVMTIQDRNRLDPSLLKAGTKCFVSQDNKYYEYNGSQWTDDGQTATFDRYASSNTRGTVIIGDNLTTDESGKLCVDVVDREAEGSTKPISAGGVYEILGDIKTIVDRI